jgi:hypothetical protein
LAATVANVTVEDMAARNGGRESKPVLHFYRCQPLVLNRRNGAFLRDRLGPVVEDWRGAKIVLELVRLDRPFGGHTHGIRIVAAERGGTPSARQTQQSDLIDHLASREVPAHKQRADDDDEIPF